MPKPIFRMAQFPALWPDLGPHSKSACSCINGRSHSIITASPSSSRILSSAMSTTPLCRVERWVCMYSMHLACQKYVTRAFKCNGASLKTILACRFGHRLGILVVLQPSDSQSEKHFFFSQKRPCSFLKQQKLARLSHQPEPIGRLQLDALLWERNFPHSHQPYQ